MVCDYKQRDVFTISCVQIHVSSFDKVSVRYLIMISIVLLYRKEPTVIFLCIYTLLCVISLSRSSDATPVTYKGTQFAHINSRYTKN